jgi:5,10-methylenetetrahydromethanopterin reductase
MRISLITNLNNESPVEACVRDMAQARDEGFARLWLTQMPFDADLLTVLAAALREVPDIEVASGVLPIQNQHPSLLAQRALTLNIIGGGRFTLGIGVTHRAVTEGMWGISWDRSVKRLSEYLDGLLPLLAGDPADAAGELVTTRGALPARSPG